MFSLERANLNYLGVFVCDKRSKNSKKNSLCEHELKGNSHRTEFYDYQDAKTRELGRRRAPNWLQVSQVSHISSNGLSSSNHARIPRTMNSSSLERESNENFKRKDEYPPIRRRRELSNDDKVHSDTMSAIISQPKHNRCKKKEDRSYSSRSCIKRRSICAIALLTAVYMICDLPLGLDSPTSCLSTASYGAHCNARFASLMAAAAEASLIIGDSAIEIQELDSGQGSSGSGAGGQQVQVSAPIGGPSGDPQVSSLATSFDHDNQPNIILGTTNGIPIGSMGAGSSMQDSHQGNNVPDNSQSLGENTPQPEGATPSVSPASSFQSSKQSRLTSPRPSPPSPLAGTGSKEDVTSGDKRESLGESADNETGDELTPEERRDRDAAKIESGEILSARPDGGAGETKAITGRVVDFELTPAGGHNKAKIKKKKKKKKKMEEASFKKKWAKKKKMEKKAMEKKHKEMMKKKKEEGKKGKKKWGHEEHGQKKKGKFKKKKWGKKVKKGKGIKKGKKGHKQLKDKGHKSSGFKTVYHKEEYGKSSKWHDIKREKKWDEKAKKWKKKWKKEKGKKYKGEHMKKFEKKKKEGKKYKKAKKEKFKKFKKEKFEKGKKMKKEEHGKKKEGGAKKMMKEEKKKEKKKKKKSK